jgi:hypothetical protein
VLLSARVKPSLQAGSCLVYLDPASFALFTTFATSGNR